MGFSGPAPISRGICLQDSGKGLDVDRGHQEPTGLAALRMDKAVDVHPLIALSNHSSDWSSLWGPNSPQDGFETDAMFIHGPRFNQRFRILVLDQGQFL